MAVTRAPGNNCARSTVCAPGPQPRSSTRGWAGRFFTKARARWVEARLPIDYRSFIGWGLLIAGLAGVGSWFFGAPFLTSSYAYLSVPIIGAVPLATAVVFDLGVFLVVVGATMLALVSIGKLGSPSTGQGAA